MDLGWWLGHAAELVGIGCVGVPVAMDLYRGEQSRPLAGDLRGADLVRAADDFLGPSVRALLVRLAEKDEYTAAHTRGVALRAVQVGDELGLPPARLRDLAIGALLHDVGKLSVPDEILKKPSGLTDEEFDVIRRHPEWGRELVTELGGFSPLVAELVMDHHERLDGSGYPRGLHGQRLSLETRVLAVCDVYDALISNRVYRNAWSQEDALELLRRESGREFDARCVAALERVLAQDQTIGSSGMSHTTAAATNASIASAPRSARQQLLTRAGRLGALLGVVGPDDRLLEDPLGAVELQRQEAQPDQDHHDAGPGDAGPRHEDAQEDEHGADDHHAHAREDAALGVALLAFLELAQQLGPIVLRLSRP